MNLFSSATVVAAAKTPNSVILSNIAYLVGAVVVAVVIITIVVLRHRRPVSTEENMDSFHRGLAALAPDRAHGGRRRSGSSSRRSGAPRDSYPLHLGVLPAPHRLRQCWQPATGARLASAA